MSSTLSIGAEERNAGRRSPFSRQRRNDAHNRHRPTASIALAFRRPGSWRRDPRGGLFGANALARYHSRLSAPAAGKGNVAKRDAALAGHSNA